MPHLKPTTTKLVDVPQDWLVPAPTMREVAGSLKHVQTMLEDGAIMTALAAVKMILKSIEEGGQE